MFQHAGHKLDDSSNWLVYFLRFSLFTRPKKLNWNQDHKAEWSGKVVKLIASVGFWDKHFLKKFQCLGFSWI